MSPILSGRFFTTESPGIEFLTYSKHIIDALRNYLTYAAQEVASVRSYFVQMKRLEPKRVKTTHETAQLLGGRAEI